MNYKEKVIALLNDQELSKEQKEKLENIFPELKENKDERIRKGLIKAVSGILKGNTLYGTDVTREEAITWLEKQGEQKKVSIWKHWKNGIAGNGEGRQVYLIRTGYTYNLSSCLSFECDYIELSELDSLMLEKQGEKQLVNFDEAEKEKVDFVGDGFIKCHADFLDFKDGETYWLEYTGDDMYNVRSDNLLGRTYHITPCQLYTVFKKLTWLEKQGNKIVDCPQNHQDVKHPNGEIVMEDFNGGEGFYKLHLDYLNKKQVEEVEKMIRTWNKESNTPDENIINCIGMCLTDANEQRFKDYDTNLKDCLEWLEKQGATDSLIKWYSICQEPEEMRELLCEWDSDDSTWHEVAFYHSDSKTFWNSGQQVKNITKWCYIDELFEKQGEKKFKVGDFIVNDYCSGKVIEITNDAYLLDTGQGIPFSCEHNAHLWTIEDAKDGDVLACSDWLFILKQFNVKGNKHKTYCHYDLTLNRFKDDTDSYMVTGSDEFHPATKEQRDQLFQKMGKAGYEWNADKKELKKIEVKTLNADKVIKWLNDQACLGWIEDVEVDKFVEKFKKDFGL